MTRRGCILALALTAGLSGCGSSTSSTPASSSAASGSGSAASASSGAPASATAPASASSTPTASGPSSGACRRVAAPAARAPQHLPTPTLRLDPSRKYTVTVVTNCGAFAFTLDVTSSPRTTASFAYLVRRGFFNGLTFHRVAAGFVIQGGDPLGDGTGGPGYTVVEPPSRTLQYVRGTVAMAKGGNEPSGASGSQFFIVTAANATQSAGLTPDYALVGHVVSGQGVVNAIGSLPTNPPQDGAPEVPVVMSRVTLSES